MKINKKIIIIFILIVALIAINVARKKSNSDFLIDRYLIQMGFEAEEDADLYSKLIDGSTLKNYYSNTKDDHSEYLYFKISDMVLRDVKLERENGIERFFTGVYDYNSGNLTYTYEISSKEVSFLLKGTYNSNEDKISCVVADERELTNYTALKETSCSRASLNVKSFKNIVKNLNKNDQLTKAQEY